MDPTVRFQQTIPYLLLPLSPSLSAVHSIRARRQLSSPYPQDPSLCPACGYYLHIGTSKSRVSRSRKSPKTRALQTICMACQDTRIAPLDAWTPPRPVEPEPVLRSAIPTTHLQVHSTIKTQSAPAADATPSVLPPLRKQPVPLEKKVAKNRTKNQNGLQAMLSRNREQEKKRNTTKEEHKSGLSAFLNNL